MNIETFVFKVKFCKKYQQSTGNFRDNTPLKLITNPEHTIWEISLKESDKICPCCKRTLSPSTNLTPFKIVFHDIPNKDNGCAGALTVFQCSMLFMIWRLGKCPIDYANYHKSIAGMKFITNIKEIQ